MNVDINISKIQVWGDIYDKVDISIYYVVNDGISYPLYMGKHITLWYIENSPIDLIKLTINNKLKEVLFDERKN